MAPKFLGQGATSPPAQGPLSRRATSEICKCAHRKLSQQRGAVGGHVYDFENHVIQVDGITNSFDGDGNRVKKVATGARRAVHRD